MVSGTCIETFSIVILLKICLETLRQYVKKSSRASVRIWGKKRFWNEKNTIEGKRRHKSRSVSSDFWRNLLYHCQIFENPPKTGIFMSKNAIIEKTLLRGLANIVWDPSITKTKFSDRFSPNFWRSKKSKLVHLRRERNSIPGKAHLNWHINQCSRLYDIWVNGIESLLEFGKLL